MTRRPCGSVASLLAAGSCRAIPNCPGRYVYGGMSGVAPEDLAGPGAEVRVFTQSSAPDPVHVVVLADGGLISYRKPDGRFVHTVNTTEGFERKLDQLGIRIP